MSQWQTICELNDIAPGTGVCALVEKEGERSEQHQIALFRPQADEQVYAISNIDPFAHASVLSRGLIAHTDASGFYVASPLKKQRFALESGVCLDDETVQVQAYTVRVEQGVVQLSL